MNFEKALYSINKGLWGTSVGGRETLGSKDYLPEKLGPHRLRLPQPKTIQLKFEKRQYVRWTGSACTSFVQLIQACRRWRSLTA